MSKGAKTLVEVCAGVKPSENALIVTDFLMTNIAESVAAVAYHAGAEDVINRAGHRYRSF